VTALCICGHKGGTAKTTTAISLSAALARQNFSTLLVDLDPQGHSTLGLGVDVGDRDLTLRDLLTEPPRPIADVVWFTSVPNLTIVPSTIHVERIAQAQYMRPRREIVLAKALQTLHPSPAFVVIDCPPSLGPLTENGIAAADWILVPCQMEARASEGLADVLELIAVLKGDAFDRWRILVTRFRAATTTTNAAIAAALADYKPHTLATVIPQNEPLNQAQIERVDIFTYAPKAPGAVAYQALAGEVLALTGVTA
jgi:chromosome partitioning protein